MRNDESDKLFERAKRTAPGSVHSDFRHSFLHFFKFAEGSRIVDADGNSFIDYHMAFGPLLLGHRNKKVLEDVRNQLERGDLRGMGSHQLELDVAEKLVQHVPCAEKVRFCNSGSEASYHALRIARAYTGRKKIIKFEGSCHGWHDYVDIGFFPTVDKLGSRAFNSGGILPEAAQNTIVLPYNDVAAVERVVKNEAKNLAAIIVEPIMHSCGCILPQDGFLRSLRELAEGNNSILIFDEVITGFRHSIGGAQKLLQVTPDLTVFAKAMGNGFPAAAVCGIAELMDQLQPVGTVHMAGTYSGHPISMAAAKATIEQLENGDVHNYLEQSGSYLRGELSKILDDEGLPARAAEFRSIFATYFTEKPLLNYGDLRRNNNEEMFNIYCSKMHEMGIFIPPQAFKRCHLSAAHSIQDLKETVAAAKIALHECKEKSPTIMKGV